MTPRRSSSARFAPVAGWSHISACIAGATTTGQRTLRSVAEKASSARPAVIFAREFAVAGATTATSAPRASSTWGRKEHR